MLADKLLKFFPFYQFLGADIKNKRTVSCAEHTVNFVDSDIAVLFFMAKKPPVETGG